jgi:hypothetical protein
MGDDVLVKLLACDSCIHPIGVHDGKGCSHRNCPCTFTKEDVLESNISIATREYRSQFGTAF